MRNTHNRPLPDDEKVTVKLKRGSYEVEISAPEGRIQQAVESVLAGMASKQPALVDVAEPEPDRRRENCRDIMVRMWKEGWFSTARLLSEVHEEMSRRGYHYDRSAVSHTLVDLVREGTLFREGSARSYRYVQKRPLGGTTPGRPHGGEQGLENGQSVT